MCIKIHKYWQKYLVANYKNEIQNKNAIKAYLFFMNVLLR